MRKRAFIVMFIFGLGVSLLAASLQTNPGYMDAFYYYYGGQQLAHGAGFQQDLLWNYLGDPAGLPYPSHTYWMPLPSLAAALGIKLFSGWLPEFRAAQLVFVLFAACVPPLSAAVSYSLSENNKFAWLAGFLSGLTGFYLPFSTATDSFAIYMVLGALFFLTFLRLGRGKYLVLGVLAGGMHMARADGIMWLGVVFAAVVIDQMTTERFDVREVFRQIWTWQFARGAAAGLAGYLVVMLPWYLRNLNLFGTLMSPGASAALWVLDYDELFSFPAAALTPARWWAAGVGEILLARGEALYLNLQTSFMSMGVILSGLLAVLGVWQYRRKKVIWLGWVAWGVLLAFMTLVFPFSGSRGSYFHSGAAFVPLIMALVPIGIDALTAASLRRFKSWKDERIRPFYTGVVLMFSVGFSLVLYFSAVVGFDEDQTEMKWNQEVTGYTAVDTALSELAVPEDAVVISANPPGFLVVSGRPSINVPDGGVETVINLAQHYGANWVLVEESHPDDLDGLFEAPEDAGGLQFVRTVEGIHIFKVEGE